MSSRTEIQMPPTMKNKKLIRIYELQFDTLYYQQEEVNIASSFF